MRILVVEDDRLLNNTLCYNLDAAGYVVDSALTKSAASNFLTKQDYDLIVLDVNLPDGNGFDFCGEVKVPWFRKAVKIAISIGQDADDEVLIEFTGNKELVLQANNATALAKMIKWASTTASMVSAPSSKPMNSVAASTPAASASTPAAASGASVAPSAPADDPFAPANNGAPLVLDMSNIPNPDDFDEGAVW